MIRRPPRSTLTDTLFPDPTLFRSFPEASGNRVLSPISGLPSKTKWLPSIQEVGEALREVTPGWSGGQRASERLDREARTQIEKRLALEYDRKDRKSTRLNSSH